MKDFNKYYENMFIEIKKDAIEDVKDYMRKNKMNFKHTENI